MTLILKKLTDWQTQKKKISTQGSTLGFVPTMGHLHEGHFSLIRKSQEDNQETLVSIFVNPTQFNCSEDLDSYPQTLADDLKNLRELSVNYILIPTYEEMYPYKTRFCIEENDLSKMIEGQSRPGHFSGVLTVVMKFLQIVNPDRAYFGEKDYQQLQLVKDMVREFFLPVEIIGCPTIRDINGLPLSSRNSKLSSKQYDLVKNFSKLLGKKEPTHEIKKQLTKQSYDLEYIEDFHNRRLGAIRIGDIRLIDNIACPFEKSSTS